ncbi:tetraspanin-18-like [Impatiens glandulifera]|uniref:tetraspanin-18-like n=1 Tax=Impatiens glandulifera TaxID=253017 RepID=UPI001FB0BA62|nr:tetraspanin-18-like [Impatiens glandulifera]
MGYCINKWYIYNTMRSVNVLVNVFGAIMIIYSLWLLKIWFNFLLHIPSPSSLPKPWFILVCLGVGISVCLITLSGYIVAHYLTKYILAIYILLMVCLLSIQAAIIVTIYFKINWEMKIVEYIDDQHKQFKIFIFFHLTICRYMTIFVLAAQSAIVVLAIILWTVGADGMICYEVSNPIDIHQSFLDYNSRPIIDLTQLEEN